MISQCPYEVMTGMSAEAGFRKRHTSLARAIRLLCPEIPADAPHILIGDNITKAKIFQRYDDGDAMSGMIDIRRHSEEGSKSVVGEIQRQKPRSMSVLYL